MTVSSAYATVELVDGGPTAEQLQQLARCTSDWSCDAEEHRFYCPADTR